MELFHYLDELRFNLYEKEIIVFLSSIDYADAKKICKHANIPQGRIYSVLEDLQKKGFVSLLPGSPKRYQLKDIKLSLKLYLENKKAELDQKIKEIEEIELKPKAFSLDEDKTSVNSFSGRDEHMNQVRRFRETAKKEIIQTASTFIGTFATRLSLRRTLERGVKVKIIILEANKKNKFNIETGLKYGAEIRENKHIKGFSMMMKDSDEAMFSAHSYENKEERTVICSRNEGLILALRKTFDEFWEKATPITLKDLNKI